MGKEPIPEIHNIEVQEGDRKQTVLIPDTGDRSYTDYLIEAETEKTRNDLKKSRKDPPKVSSEETAQAIKEYNEFRKRKKEGTKKYF